MDGKSDSQTMFIHIINQPTAFFKHQQRDEADLSREQKLSIVANLFDTNKSAFLQRYGKFLDENQLSLFDDLGDDDLAVQVRELRQRLKSAASLIRNRRFRAMEQLLKNSDYFSSSEMQTRNPYLFELMVGQHMNHSEQKQLQDDNYRNNYDHVNFSSFLLEQMRTSQLKCKSFVQQQIEENVEEFDEEDEEEEEKEDDNEDKMESSNSITAEEKRQLKKEFQTQMMEHFLEGKDGEFFDYSQVDNDDQFDSEEMERLEQERYFDEW